MLLFIKPCMFLMKFLLTGFPKCAPPLIKSFRESLVRVTQAFDYITTKPHFFEEDCGRSMTFFDEQF